MQNCYYNKQRFLRKITVCSPFASIQKKRGEKKRTQLGTTLLLKTLILWSITIFHLKYKYFHRKLPLKNVQLLKTVKQPVGIDILHLAGFVFAAVILPRHRKINKQTPMLWFVADWLSAFACRRAVTLSPHLLPQ